ncbi:MAG: hypothetical protein AB1894_19650 [Chloroflexota bacterium]
MQISSEFKDHLSSPAEFIPTNWSEHLAKWVSNILSPPVLALFGIFLAAQAIGSIAAWWWSSYYVLLTVALPCGYIVWKVRRGEISDFHMRVRQERIRPMLLMLACCIAAWSTMLIAHAPTVLLLFATMGILQVAFLLLVTLRWKISGHGTAIGSLAVFLWSIFGPMATPAVIAIPLVAWARLRLNRHDLSQTIVGTLAGIVFMLAVLSWVASVCQGVSLFCH